MPFLLTYCRQPFVTAGLFCEGPASKHFHLHEPFSLVTTSPLPPQTGADTGITRMIHKIWPGQYMNKQLWMCPNKTFPMDTESSISCNIHVSRNTIFLFIFFHLKIILSSRTIPKQKACHIWLEGHCRPLPASFSSISAEIKVTNVCHVLMFR